MENNMPNYDMIQQLLGIEQTGQNNFETGNAITNLQGFLIKEGYLSDDQNTGIWTKETDSAVVKYLNDYTAVVAIQTDN